MKGARHRRLLRSHCDEHPDEQSTLCESFQILSFSGCQAAFHHPKANAAAHGNLRGQWQVIAGDGRDHGIASRQRVVCQKQDGLAIDWHLDGSSDRAFAGQFLVLCTLQRLCTLQANADTVALRCDAPFLRQKGLHCNRRKPVRARAQYDIERDQLSRTWQCRLR